MRRLTSAFILAFACAGPATRMSARTDTAILEKDSSPVSLFEYVTKTPKRSQAFNLDLELHAGFYADFYGGRLDEAAFRFRDVKLNISGEVNDRLSYAYRQRLNGSFEGPTLDNLNESIEYAYIGYKLSDRFTLTAGKQDAFFGGWEYDPNPLEIYQYSDMNDYIPCFLTGLGLAYQASETQEIRVQVTDSRVGSLEDDYGRLPEGIEKPKVPLYYFLNWNSSYLDEQVNLRYSVSMAEQAEGKYMYNVFAGQNLEVGPVYAYLDGMYSRGQLDPLGLLSFLTLPDEGEEEADALPTRLRNCDYFSLVAEVKYRLHPKWQLLAKGMYETASIYKTYDTYEKGKYRTAWGYQGGVEFYPMADDNLHVFVHAIGQTLGLTDRAKAVGMSLENTLSLAVGFVYKLPLY